MDSRYTVTLKGSWLYSVALGRMVGQGLSWKVGAKAVMEERSRFHEHGCLLAQVKRTVYSRLLGRGSLFGVVKTAGV